MKIFYFEGAGGDAVDYYRAESPISTLHRFGQCAMLKADVNEIPRIINGYKTENLPFMESADVFVVNRMGDYRFVEALRGINPKAAIVADYDDNSFEVSPLSPHYETNGTREVRYMFADGNSVDLWVDIKNKDKYKGAKQIPGYIDIEKNKAMLEDIKKVSASVDLVTVTTEKLGEVFSPYAKNISVLPNCINKNIWKKIDFKKAEEFRMGWFGGFSHYEDWTILSDVLPEIMNRNRNIKLVLMGTMFKGTLKDIPKEKIEFHPWVGREAFPYKAMTLNLDLALIPLKDNAFNRGKSPIKFVEMSSMGVPTVGSYVSPYREVATETNGVWIESEHPEAWIQGIQMMIDDERMRRSVAHEAYRTVMTNFEIHGQAHKWAKAYKGALHGVTNAADPVGTRG